MSPRHTFVSRNTDGTWTVNANIVEKFADEIRARSAYFVVTTVPWWYGYDMGYLEDLLEVAGEQRGFVTTTDAKGVGVPPVELRKMAARGVLVRRGHGLYRIVAFASQRNDELMEAVLWVGGNGVISHESALDLWGVADVNPRYINVTVARRTRRLGGALYRLWPADLDMHEIDHREGIPTTSVRRSILDSADAGTNPRLIEQAIRTAERHDHISAYDANDLFTTVEARRMK
jgi:predicted transcriptional regulator of viral defense system